MPRPGSLAEILYWSRTPKLNSVVSDTAAAVDVAGTTEVLRLEGISKTFHRGTHRAAEVLKDVHLTVDEGEVLVVIGPSGSGKSTLLRCINFTAPPDAGRVVFCGREVRGAAAGISPLARLDQVRELVHLRTHIGMVFQHFNLFPHMTALQNVALAPKRVLKLSRREAEERAKAELDRVGLGGKLAAYPSQLSGGQKQRVAIARALAMKPKLMLFDEVTSALDPELVRGVLDEVKKLALAGMTMIVVTHEMAFAREVGDRIIFMDGGQVVEEGPARRLLGNPQSPRTQQFLRAFL